MMLYLCVPAMILHFYLLSEWFLLYELKHLGSALQQEAGVHEAGEASAVHEGKITT